MLEYSCLFADAFIIFVIPFLLGNDWIQSRLYIYMDDYRYAYALHRLSFDKIQTRE